MQSNQAPARSRFRSRAWLVVGIIVLVAVGVGAAGFVYFFDQNVPAAVSLNSAPSPTAAGGGSASGGSTGAPVAAVSLDSAAQGSPAPAAAGTAATAPAGLDGTWKIDTSLGSFSDFTSSFVGYRVAEQLANIGATTAVGRTPNVSGTLTFAGSSITAVSITADLTALQSDRPMRDGQLHTQGLQTDAYPTATFVLADPITLAQPPTEGQTISVTATGDLTIHGVTKRVSIPLQARLSGGVVTVVGSLPIAFADYSMTPPHSMMVLSVADNGTMELQLHLTKG